MGQQLFVHVGMMKSGTTFIQHTLRANADEIRRQGLAIVPPRRHISFRMALDLRGQAGAGKERRKGAGSLSRLPRKLQEAGDVDRLLISEEVLSGATVDEVARFGELLGDRELHVVLTVRDIARTIPSMWQQNIKGGKSVPYQTYVESVTRREGEGAELFWGAQDALAVLRTWATLVDSPDRVHVVVVPQSGAPRNLLLERFCSVVGLDASALTNEPRRVNDSLGLAQAELMRRVNERLPSVARQSDLHAEVIKQPFAVDILGAQDGQRIKLPSGYADWCRQYAETAAAEIRAAGYRVVGSLDELSPDPSVFTEDDVVANEAAIAASAVDALVTLFEHRVVDYQAEIDRRQQRAAQSRTGRKARPGPAVENRSESAETGAARAEARRRRRLVGRVGEG